MASALLSRTRTLITHKPQLLSSFFTEKWFSVWPLQDHSTYKTTSFHICDLVWMINGLRATFSTCSVSTDQPAASFCANLQEADTKVLDATCNNPDEKHNPLQDHQLAQKNCQDLFRAWGCNDQEITQILERVPSLHNARLDKLQSKLELVHSLGFSSSELVKIVSCRPRFLRSKIEHDDRIQYLETLFCSREMLKRAILRNPSLLTYDLNLMIKPTIELYESMGLSRNDLILMLLSRPTLIPRTSLNSEKLEYIKRTGTPKNSKMYKYVVTIMGVSRLETIREKITNFEKFFDEDDVFRLVGRSPLALTLSVDKVQRNMTFVVADMKLPASVVLSYPFLLFNNLETWLKPRMLLAAKIDDLGLVPRIKGSRMFTALRMKEKRFVKAFIKCHPVEIAENLMDYYDSAKHVKRLAEESKKTRHKGFPF